ncbi:unnamed protein product [Hermetia illucens]|uniref:G-protein coupled receptors family 1 profile domain-containing protein n=1 Tax=Hermetia illucens TaxID=343691 RepID=A0A7R8UJZ9_HERIL|nr:opsin, ultraviolet-sensitive isoform X2 [Hermetia illucens]CAD7082265.1 unnamed protein product [Hermetia illucens]
MHDNERVTMDHWTNLTPTATIPLMDNVSTPIITNNTSIDDPIGLNFSQYPALRDFQGDLDMEYIKLINPFWLKFDPPSQRAHYTLGALYILLLVIGFSGNAFVIFMFLRCKSLRTPANTLVLNLAVSDFLMMSKIPIAIYNCFHCGPALGDSWCKFYGFAGGLTGTLSITTLTAISIDRYHVVVYPLDPLKSTTKRRSRLMVLFVWCYSFIFAIIPALDIGLSHYVPEGYLTTCSFDYLSKSRDARIFMFAYWIAAWCIPFSIITYCYVYILRVVISANSIQSSKDKNKTEFKLAIVIIGIIGLWFLAWTPYSVVALLGISGNETAITPLGSMIPALFCKSAAAIDPYVYAVTHPRFRMELGRIFCGRVPSTLKRASTYQSSVYTKTSTRRRIAPDVKDEPRVLGQGEEMSSFSGDALERSSTIEGTIKTTLT